MDIIKYLIERGADINNKCGGTPPLYWAAYCHRLDVVEFLVLIGADVNGADNGMTALHWASSRDLAMVKFLVGKGANVNAISEDTGATPLHWASGNLPIVEFLVEKGADFRIADESGQTPLHFAAEGFYRG